MITTTHNPDRLQYRCKAKVINTAQAYHFIQRVMDTKRPRGMRLRYSENKPTGEIWFESRNEMPLRTMLPLLRDAGLLRR